MNASVPAIVVFVALLQAEAVIAAPPTASASPPANFEFIYGTGWGTRIDTYTNRYTHDLVVDPDTTIRLVLTKSEMAKIYSAMERVGFFAIRQPHPPYGSCSEDPNTTVLLEARAGSRTRRFSWSTEFCDDGSQGWRALYEVEELIQAILAARPEVRRLPKPRGGYL